MNYFVPNFGVDEDIKATKTNYINAEASLNKTWTVPKDGYTIGWATNNREYLQTETESEREPLLTWAPTEPASHPVNYFVPNFGQDHEIAYTQ